MFGMSSAFCGELADARARSGGTVPTATKGVELRSRSWQFKPSQLPVTTLTLEAPRAEFTIPGDGTNSLTVRLTVNLKSFTGTATLLEIPGVVNVALRQHDPGDRNRQNYPAFKMPDGSVPVLEANLALHSLAHPDWKNMLVGLPLALLEKPFGPHEVVLSFTGVHWRMYVDGDLVDADFPVGYPQWPARALWRLNPEFALEAALYVPGIEPVKDDSGVLLVAPQVQFWTPFGHNSWVGDVQTFFHRGRYHVFYLYDRRHHQSKFGCGAHYFEHLSTTDFKRWTEHETATPLEHQWECIGTGVPFVFNDQLCLSYGWHTTRVVPEKQTTLPAQRTHLEQHGKTGTFRIDAVPGVPAGATYSVSADGVANFKKANLTFHPCENPSVYTDPGGKLRMLANYRARGTWESESIDGGWRCVNPDFPPGGDCTVYFRWGQFDYVIGGFTGLWRKPVEAPDSAYADLVSQGLDFYDGSNVPSVTGLGNGRFLMAGWLPIRGWGGVLLIRELIQYPDGRIGSKWMREITPEIEQPTVLALEAGESSTFPVDGQSFSLSFMVRPEEARRGKLGISFLPEGGEDASCELQVSLDDLRAQFGPGSRSGFAPRQRSLREGGAPQEGRNYAIENLIGVEEPFAIRVLVIRNEKIGGSLIDAEIAGQRTLISYRPDLTVTKLLVRREHVALSDLRIGRLP